MSSTFGTLFTVSTWGETRGRGGVGCSIDGCPAGLVISPEEIQYELNRRRPGQSKVTTPRREGDIVEIFSGWLEGRTTGAPIALRVKNDNQSNGPEDDPEYDTYKYRKVVPRPGHADYSYSLKYGGNWDYRHGGRSSARETAARVAAGAVAKKALSWLGVEILAYTTSIYRVHSPLRFDETMDVNETRARIESNIVRALDCDAAQTMQDTILKAKREGDSVGGIIEVVALNVPTGLGEPIFDKLQALLAKAMFSIPAVAAVGMGDGLQIASMKGSEYVDELTVRDGKVMPETNRAGGIKGGISIGAPIVMQIAMKPTTSIIKEKKSVNLKTMKEEMVSVEGQHDPCIVPRAVPIIEAMMALTLADVALIAQVLPRVLTGNRRQQSVIENCNLQSVHAPSTSEV